MDMIQTKTSITAHSVNITESGASSWIYPVLALSMTFTAFWGSPTLILYSCFPVHTRTFHRHFISMAGPNRHAVG